MTPRRPSARQPQEVLERRPWLAGAPTRKRPVIDTVDQLDELVALLDRGLISRAAFDEQKRKVLGT